MSVHQWYKTILGLAACWVLAAGVISDPANADEASGAKPTTDATTGSQASEETEKLAGTDIEIPPYQRKSNPALRRELGSLPYRVTQQEATEPAFHNAYWNNKREGLYRCIVCGYPLFSSETKFKSGTGWPSFYAPLSDQVVGSKRDWKMFYPRTEVHCARCKAHLGHVFQDGPRPTGLRYCLNSASLDFDASKEAKEQPQKPPGRNRQP